MKLFFCICLLLCFHSLVAFPSFDFRSRAYKIALNAANPVQKKYHLDLVGTGSSSPRDTFDQIILGFLTQGPITKEEARQIVVELVEGIAYAYNADEKIRPYLKNFPFALENIDISIYVHEEDNSLSYHPKLGVAGTLQNKVYYYTRNLPPNTPYYKSEEEEPYEEAKRIVKSALFNGGEN